LAGFARHHTVIAAKAGTYLAACRLRGGMVPGVRRDDG